jgi:hypothetical protein
VLNHVSVVNWGKSHENLKEEARKITQHCSAKAEYQAMATIKMFYWDQKYPSKTPHEIAEATLHR